MELADRAVIVQSSALASTPLMGEIWVSVSPVVVRHGVVAIQISGAAGQSGEVDVQAPIGVERHGLPAVTKRDKMLSLQVKTVK